MHVAVACDTVVKAERHSLSVIFSGTVVQALPPPGGLGALAACRDVAAWLSLNSASWPSLDWATVPHSCDPGITLGQPEVKPFNTAFTSNCSQRSCSYTAGAPSTRGWRKRWQVESFAMVLQQLFSVAGDAGRQYHLVDFGCGTGALALALAALLPSCQVTGVEMKPAAAQIAKQRAEQAGITNFTCHVGMIENFDQPFDVALALHACGNATDWALLKAAQQRAVFLVSPCCVGKLKFSAAGGSSFSATVSAWTPTLPGDRPSLRHELAAQAAAAPKPVPEGLQSCGRHSNHDKTAALCEGKTDAALPRAAPCMALRHPRSAWLRQSLPDPDRHFRLLAKAADTLHASDQVSPTVDQTSNAAAATCSVEALFGLPVAADSSLLARQLQQQHNGKPSQEGALESGADVSLARSARAPGTLRAAAGTAGAPEPPATSAPELACANEATPLFAPLPAYIAAAGHADATVESSQTAGSTSAAAPQGVQAAALAPCIRAAVTHAAEAAAAPAAAMPEASSESGTCAVTGLEAMPAPALDVAAMLALCRLHVEIDRCEAAREVGYHASIFRLLHADAMAKGDLLVGVPAELSQWYGAHPLLQWQH